jgi:hypothetical protein
MTSRNASTRLTVIPANAGIQLNTSCEALKTFMTCAAHAIFDWIPACAGMTSKYIAAECGT